MSHNYQQQLVFLAWINKVLDNDFLALEVRQREQGMDLTTKKYIQDLPEPDISKQEANEVLFTYVKKLRLRSRNLQNIIDDLQILIECQEDINYLNQQLNDNLETLRLPTL